MAETNPNGANGTTSDPREQIMWDIYVKALDSGIDNAKAAALEAGYSESYSNTITVVGWFSERKDKLRRKGLLSKAERILDKTLTYNAEEEVEQEDGSVKVVIDKGLLKIQTEVAKVVATTLGSKEGYVSKSEVELTTLSEEEKDSMRGLLQQNDNESGTR